MQIIRKKPIFFLKETLLEVLMSLENTLTNVVVFLYAYIFVHVHKYVHSNLDIKNLDIVNKTQLPFSGFTKPITFDIVNYLIQ